MAWPKFMQRLFANDGAGPLLRTDIIPDLSGNYLSSSGGTVNGDLDATGTITATKLGSSTIGSATQPIYLSAGTATACNTMVDTTSSQTITGSKIFSNSGSTLLSIRSTSVDYNTVPSSSCYPAVVFTDVNDYVRGRLEYVNSSSAGVYTQLYAYPRGSHSGSFCGIKLGYDADSNPFAKIGSDTGTTITLTVSGITKSTSFQATSDSRLKPDRKEAFRDLSGIKTYEYTLTVDKKRHVGLIAQEVEAVIPEAVSENEDGYKSLDYNAVVAALVGEVNDLKRRVAALEPGDD